MSLSTGQPGHLRPLWRFVLGFIFAFFLANMLAASVAMHVGELPSLGFDLVYRPAWVLLLLAGFTFFAVLLDRVSAPLPFMGLGRPWGFDALKGLGIGAGMVFVGAACIAQLGTLRFSGLDYRYMGLRAGAVLFVLITAAMAEELTFRGYPFQRLREATGSFAAVLIMSLLFGAVHLANPHASLIGFLNTALIGGVLCVAYLRTWRLWLPFGIHLGWNLTLGTVLGLPVSGLNEFSVYVLGRARGPLWVTGGAYGLEASLVGTGVSLLGFLALLAFVPQTQRPEVVSEAEAPFSVAVPPAPQPGSPAEQNPGPESGTDTRPPDAHPTE